MKLIHKNWEMIDSMNFSDSECDTHGAEMTAQEVMNGLGDGVKN